jgi:uncharacterized protein
MPTLYAFVTGPSSAGKSQFIYSLGDPDSWVQDETVGIQYRTLEVDESLDVVVFCSIEAARFDQLLDIPERDLLGYIVVVDSTDPDTWGEAQVMMKHCRGYALLPTVIAANKQDLPGARDAAEVGAWLGMDAMTSVQPCDSTDPELVRNVFLGLLYSVKSEIERLDALIAELEKLATESNEEP